jgi:putative spermidine/putrescine transport system permease protein
VVAVNATTWRVVRTLALLLFAAFFAIPLLAMLDFSTRGAGGGRSWDAWANLVQDPELRSAIVTSLLHGPGWRGCGCSALARP